MYDHLISQNSADNTNAQSQISCGPHLNGIVFEKSLFLRVTQMFVSLSRLQKPMAQSQVFGMLQHLVDTPSGFHRTCNSQTVVFFKEQSAAALFPVFFFHPLFHIRDFRKRGLNKSIPLSGLRKIFHEQRGKPFQSFPGLFNVLLCQRKILRGFLERNLPRVDPQDFFSLFYFLQQGIVLNLHFQVFHSFSSRQYGT